MADYEVNIGAKVRTKDGKKIGSIEKLIVHPDTNYVDGFMLDTGVLSTGKIVSAGQVASTDADGIVLSVTEADLTNYVQEQMIKSTGNLSYGVRMGGMVDVQGSDQWQMQSRSGTLAPGGGNSLYQQAPIGNIEVQNVDNMPDDSIVISEDTEILCSDGKKIGHVDEVFVNQRKITGFVIKSGHLRSHKTHIPWSAVAGMSHTHVRLNISSEEVAKLPPSSGS